MESVFAAGGFQLPFQRRLSRLYNDTKKSSDFVTQPVQNGEDPDIKALHRKLRIQKDRFVSWGMEWSDPNQTTEIDESLSRAGLSEVVGSILSTIRDILAEAEPLWQSSKGLVGSGKASEKKSGDKKIPIVAWDKGRFEDLIRDLTTSIDTLYDLSRTRSSAALSSGAGRARMFKSASSTEDLRPFESSRMQTPQQIDPSTLTNLRSLQAEPMSESIATVSFPREVVFMGKQAWSELSQRTGQESWAPLLLEYSTFDSIYASTGITPPMARFEKLSAGLQQPPQRSPGTWTGLPRLLGYFEDLDNARLGLVYHFPPSFNAVSFENHTQNPLNNLCTLSDLLTRPDFEPRLEAKFRLANNLANTVFDLHARGITHGNLFDRNISFCNAASTELTATAEVDVRRPLISSFDLFPDASSEEEPAPFLPLYRHPLDPRTTPSGPVTDKTDSRILDLYSLAMVLVSIGLWTKLENLAADPTSPGSISESILEQLAIRCGTLYMKAVQACWEAVDQELAGRSTGEQLLSSVQVKASRYLEACCIIDCVSGLDERLSTDLGEVSLSHTTMSSTKGQSSGTTTSSGQRQTLPDIKPTAPQPRAVASQQIPGNQKAESGSIEANVNPTTTTPAQPAPKLRLYPQVPLPPDVVDKWNSIVMPQINQALRHFYRKHPESVEISLQPIGISPQKTRPTVLVVCTSVSTVKAILKRKAGQLFEGATGFGLKVCKGQVLRSRKESNTVKRSNAGTGTGGDDGNDGGNSGSESQPANPGFQERPNNGASIGAWIGDRHLPPVSFGGLVIVDDKPYGMTVHHMLDDPDQVAAESQKQPPHTTASFRSMARPNDSALRDFYADPLDESSGSEDYAGEFSDSESDALTETDFTSDASDDEHYDDEEDEFNEPGDIPGVEPGCGDGYIVTQPAMDDVDDGFYPSADTADEDHLDSFSLGEIYASSGIRRRKQHGLLHEIDWALFEFQEERLPCDNSVPKHEAPSAAAQNQRKPSTKGPTPLCPTTVAPASALPGLEVQCIARTSGLQTGLIMPALASIKIYGRTSPSHTYQVSSHAAYQSGGNTRIGERRQARQLSMGIPGDSGAWVIDRHQGLVCGHVLAWSERKKVAYICPMDVLLLDIAETLGAGEVRLPGGEPIITILDAEERAARYGEEEKEEAGYEAEPVSPLDDEADLEDLLDDERDYDGDHEAPPMLVPTGKKSDVPSANMAAGEERGQAGAAAASHGKRDSETYDMSRKMESLNIGSPRGRLGVGMYN